MTAPPLIMIAQGRKPRPRKAPRTAAKEIMLHIAVAKLLRDHCLPDWVWFHVPNGELRDVRTAAKLKRMGVKPGIPDFALVSPYGSVRFLELKRLGEKLSDAQEDFGFTASGREFRTRSPIRSTRCWSRSTRGSASASN